MKTFLRTSDNHLECGIFERPSILGLGDLAAPVFYTRPGRCTEQPRTPLQEARRAARKLFEEQGGEVSLCVSGGVDSDAMLQAFVQEGIPFRAYVFRYLRSAKWASPWNHHDLKDAFRSFRHKSVPFEVVDILAQNYFESGEVFKDAQTFLCPSPQLCLQLRILDQIPGCPVFAWNAPNSESATNTDAAGLGLPGFKYFAFQRYFEHRKRAGVPFFFLYTPELLYSFMNLQRFQNAKVGSYELKCDLYRDGGFQIESRENKFTGFEKLRRYYDQKTGHTDEFNKRFRYPLIDELKRRTDFRKRKSALSTKIFCRLESADRSINLS